MDPIRNTLQFVPLVFVVVSAVARQAVAQPRKPAGKADIELEKQRVALIRQAEGHLETGDHAAAKATLDRCAELKGLGGDKRFAAKALAAGAAGVADLAVMRRQIDRLVAAGKVPAAARAAAFEHGAKLFNGAGQYGVVREFLRLGAELVAAKPRNVYRCRFLADPPLGAAGWALSTLLDDPKYREARFGPYSKAHAEGLVTDVSGQRGAQQGGEGDDDRPTAFYMAYNARGWHMFVLSREPDIQAIGDRGDRAGTLEMAFSPGFEGACYYQWIANLAENDFHLYDWDSPHRNFRSLKGSLRCETIPLPGAFGTYVFIPWMSLYDKLPMDGGKWPFSVIRWKKGGGVTWGGKVHEIGRWGLVEWDKPTPQQKLAIQTAIVKRAWGAYRKARAARQRLWQDPEVGDPAFYKAALAPAIQRLDKYGEPLDKADKLTAEQVARLVTEAVPDWMEFDYAVAELRAEYLRKQLMKP
ncbi:MAG: hypothetical protein WBF17_18190 [Phycisphaerae bacterium]